jgi:hypothetical protein
MSLQHFNPHDMGDAMVRKVATGREAVLAEILDTARQNLAAPSNQHLLAIAPRGYGKSFLARLAALHLADLRQAGLPVGVALLPEEQPNVTAPHLLIEEIRRVFEGKPADSVIPTWFDEGDDALAWGDALVKLDGALDSAFGPGQGLLVAMVENFDELLNNVFRDGDAQSRLRKLLAEHPRLMLLATSTSAAQDKSYDARLFHAFRQLDLEPWTEQQCIDYFNRQLQALEREALDGEGEARARALTLFIGGTPRLATLLAEILADKDASKAAAVLDLLLDRLTPYYKHRIESLAFRPRKLLDALLRLGEPCSQSELAQRVGATQAAIAQPFQELQRERLVVGQRASGGREMLYRVTDRVLAHYYRKRFLDHGLALSPLEAIAEFLEAFFSADEKRGEAERLRQMGREADAAFMEMLALREMGCSGSWRSHQHCLCAYAGVIADGALWRFRHVLKEFREYRPKEALQQFQHVEGETIPDNEWLIGLLIAGSAGALLDDRRERAFRRLDEAVRLAAESENGTAEWRFAAFKLRGVWRWAKGDTRGAQADFQAAADLAQDLESALFLRHANYEAIWTRPPEEAEKHARQLLHEAREARDDFIACRALRQIAWSLGRLGRHGEAAATAEQAIAIAEKLGDQRELVASTRGLAWDLCRLERREEAVCKLEGAIRLAEEINDSYERAISTRLLASVLGRMGRREESLRAAEAALALAEALKNPQEQAWALLEIFRQSCALNQYERAVGAYAGMLVAVGDAAEGDLPKPCQSLACAARAALAGHAWPRLQEGVIAHPGQFVEFPPETAAALAQALSLKAQSDPAAAFAAAARFVDALAPVLNGEDRRVAAPLQAQFTELFRAAMGALARGLQDPGLLRDIARRVAERMPPETESLCQLLEAAARYAESGGDPRSLERVDPDIAMAIRRTRGGPG